MFLIPGRAILLRLSHSTDSLNCSSFSSSPHSFFPSLCKVIIKFYIFSCSIPRVPSRVVFPLYLLFASSFRTLLPRCLSVCCARTPPWKFLSGFAFPSRTSPIQPYLAPLGDQGGCKMLNLCDFWRSMYWCRPTTRSIRSW